MPLTDRLPVSSYPAFDVGRNAIQAAEIISADETKNKTRNETLENNTLISTYAGRRVKTLTKAFYVPICPSWLYDQY